MRKNLAGQTVHAQSGPIVEHRSYYESYFDHLEESA